VKFTQEGSVELRATLERTGPSEWLVVEIADTGIGIPPDKLEGIFQSFQQGERGLSRGYPGLGLGLALTKKLSQVMGGRISVESLVGKGSIFTVRVPLVRPIAIEPIHEAAPVADGPFILAVDDNSVGLTILRRALVRKYNKVDCVASGIEALE